MASSKGFNCKPNVRTAEGVNDMGTIKIGGGLDIARLSLNNEGFSEDYKTHIGNLAFGDEEWSNSSVVLANMKNDASGNGADYQFKGIDHFKIYKTIGNNSKKLHKVAETAVPNERIIEDFIVGDMCDYQYFVYPVCKPYKDNKDTETIGTPIISDKIQLNEGVIAVMALLETDEENVYIADRNNMWLLSLNVQDNGMTLNTNKNFSDTNNRYPQETGTYRAYKSKSITALLGNIDYVSKDFTDTYERLEAWDEFCRSGSLKALVDLRGRILIGDIDNNPTSEYGKSVQRQATVSFPFKELDSIENITILGNVLAVEGGGAS